MKRNYVLLVLLLFVVSVHAQIEYTGDNLLMVVGKNKTSYDFKEFKTFWLLDSKLESNYGGIKILMNTATQTADTLLLAGNGYTLGETRFYGYSSKLPWGIKMSDKYSEIAAKTSSGNKTSQGYLFEFVGYSMLVNYNNDLKIRWIKLFTNQKQPESKQEQKPTIADAVLPRTETAKVITPPAKPVETQAPKKAEAILEQPRVLEEPKKEPVKATPVAKAEEPKKEEPKKEDVVVKKEEPKPVVKEQPAPVKVEEPKKEEPKTVAKEEPVAVKVEAPKKEEPKPVVKEEVKDVAPVKPAEPKKDTVHLVNKTPFHMAISNVFYAYDESSFESVKGEKMDTANFWSYKFIWKSKLKIPGEKYSMVYCYPYINSSEDFITVIREGNFDGGFGAAYSDMEMRMRQNLTGADGWKATYLPSGGKPVNPIEFKHSKYGSVILDYAKNAKNQHLLFLHYKFEDN